MCDYCLEHRAEFTRDRSISVSDNAGVHTATGEPYKSSLFKKFSRPVVIIKPEEVPEDFFFLRAGLAAANDGTLKGTKK